MLRLYLFRHEKTESSMLSDFTRILTDTGRTRAAETGKLFKDSGYQTPDIIFASTAARAQETAAIFIKNSQYHGILENFEELYSADENQLMNFIARNSGENRTVMVIAHNPAIENLTGRILGMGVIMKPGYMAVLDLDIENWNQDCIAKGKLVDLFRADI